MSRVIGIGGIVFRAKDADALRTWYQDRLGITMQAWGGAIFTDLPANDAHPTIAWSIVERASPVMDPSTASFMVTYRVQDLLGLVRVLRAEGCEVTLDLDATELGRFAWLIDPEGNKVELWEPPRAATKGQEACYANQAPPS